MRFIFVAANLAFAICGLAAPFNPFPLPDGFPNPNNATALRDIERPAGGLLPPNPNRASNSTLENFQLIAFNELFEVAFFVEFWTNVTNKVPGYETPPEIGRDTYIIQALEHVVAQEQIHALAANNILGAFGVPAVAPCNYMFPVSTFNESVIFAQTFTDLVIGTLMSVQDAAAMSNDSEIVRTIGSIIGQEGEQNGFYRFLQDKVPAGQPFMTGSAAAFAFNQISRFIVPGTCPELEKFAFPTFQPLNVLQGPTGKCGDTDEDVPTGTCDDHVVLTWKPLATNETNLKVVYMNGLIDPIVENFSIINKTAELITVSAPFPVNGSDLYGLTIVAITEGDGPFMNPEAVAEKTILGPGLIEYEFQYGG